MKDLVIFDMSGVLFDTETVLYESNQRAFAKENINFEWEDYLKYAGTSQKQNRRLTIEKVGDEALGNKIYQDAYDIRLEIYKEKGAPKKEGLDELLKALAKAGIKMIVASSNDLSMVQTLIDKAGIGHYFDGIVAGDQMEEAKPHPDIYLKALASTGIAKEKAIAIEDSLNGVEACQRANLDVIMVPDLIEPTAKEKAATLAICETIDQCLPFILES